MSDDRSYGEIYWAAANEIAEPWEALSEAYRERIQAGAVAVAEDVQRRGFAVQAEPGQRYALVEQMGFRRVYGTVRETELVGKKMLEVTELGTGQVRLVGGDSLYQVTWLTRDQAERGAGVHAVAAITGTASGAGIGWGGVLAGADDENEFDDDDHADRCADSLEGIEDRA